ncbi:cryptic protein-like isoform 2-T2 [Glossophaga mutica]
MARSVPVRLLFMISLALQIVPLGNSCQREHHEGSREEIHNATVQRLQQKTFNWTRGHFRDGNGSTQDPLPQAGASQARAPPRPRCCMNGGTCVLGSFCVCSAHFTGRYCEHDQRHRPERPAQLTLAAEARRRGPAGASQPPALPAPAARGPGLWGPSAAASPELLSQRVLCVLFSFLCCKIPVSFQCV